MKRSAPLRALILAWPLGTRALRLRDEKVCEIEVADRSRAPVLTGYSPCEGCRVVFWSGDAMVVEDTQACHGAPRLCTRHRQLALLSAVPGGDPQEGRHAYKYDLMGEIVCGEARGGEPAQALPVPANGTWAPCLREAPCDFSPKVEGAASWSDTQGWVTAQLGGNLARLGADPSPRVLQLGLGTGLMTRWIRASLPGARVDVVDLNPAVVAAAPCNGIAPSARLAYHVEDARAYLERQARAHPASLDSIFYDIDYRGRCPCIRTAEFFGAAHRALKPGGVLTVNVPRVERTEAEQMARNMGAVFPDVRLGQAKGYGNQILLARKLGEATGGTAAGSLADTLRQWEKEAGFHGLDYYYLLPKRDVDFPECRNISALSKIGAGQVAVAP